MAVQYESQSQLQEFLGILRRRSWQVILPAAFVIAIGAAFAVIVPKKYLASTQIELRNTENAKLTDEVKSAGMQLMAIERIRKVVRELKWVDFLALDPKWHSEYLRDVKDAITVTNTKGSDQSAFVTIEYKNINPKRASEFLQALRDLWIKDVIDRGRNQIISEAQRLLDRKNELQKQYYKAEEELTELRRRHGISATQPMPGSDQARNEDPVFERNDQNQRGHDKALLELASLTKRIEGKEAQYVDVPEMISEEQLVQGRGLDQELAAVDRDINLKQEQKKSYRPQHSKYRILEHEIAELEIERRALLGGRTEGEIRTRLVPNPARVKLREEIDQLKLERAVLEQTRDQLKAALERDGRLLAERQEVYREIRTRAESITLLHKTREETELRYESRRRDLERLSSPGANPFEVTQEVETPRKPTEPSPILIVALAVVLGFAVGLGYTVVAEYSRNCFRSVDDIARVLVAPVLGTVNTILTTRDVRRRSTRRLLVGGTSVSLIGLLVFVTWAWAANPELLPQGVRQAIENLRSHLV